MARSLLLAALLVATPALAADTPAPAVLPDLVGPRGLALSSGIGIAASNEGLFVNPGAIGARKRYSLEAGAFLDRRGSEDVGRYFAGSVVDSMSSPLTGGLGYVYADEGPYTGGVWDLAFAAPIGEGVLLGFGGKYFDVDGPRPSRAVTVDAGLLWQVAELVSVGAVGYNLVPISNEAIAPMGFGAGIGVGNDRSFQVTADWRADFDRAGKTTNRYGAGAEVLVGRFLPLRAGFLRDETLGGRWWSAGAGLISQSGLALDLGYRQSLDDKNARTFAANLKLFLFR